MKTPGRWLGAACWLVIGGCVSQNPSPTDWRRQLAEDLRLFGHRNWIVVADSAYPAQSRAGIDTRYAGGDQLEVVGEVLAAIDAAPHVRATVWLDAELGSIAEADAPGIGAHRDALEGMLSGRPVQRLPHEEIIERLDRAATTFRVLLLKTDLALPYTSVFLELDCGYWSADAEARLRGR